ncbi:MAG: tyrosine-type recombinase/integrase [Synergistes jonesii]|uniref:tyrosine-type recombinase/integrase n=1 Tax=Synergistes jonesii TaxID=2754 RepID=UPI002A75DA21|nr:tyrosine-type recombinase/integrase [Synergistes jonesii]MDY2983825.1 tyrosine-type recombinase/integrase [Synergistes jonesii]
MLTEIAVRDLRPKEQRYMKADRDGLYIEVVPSGIKYWWFVMQRGGKRRKFSLGRYPELSLKAAREACALKKREVGIASGLEVPDVLFGELAEEWYKTRILPLSANYSRTVRMRLDKYLLPRFAGRPAAFIKGKEILALCKEVEREGFIETAHRVLDIFAAVFQFGIPTGMVPADPTAGLSANLMPVRAAHFAALTDRRDVAELMRGIRYYRQRRVRNALLFSAYTFCRPGEVRGALWRELDLPRREWRIPAERMKGNREHVVPLSRQAAEVLEDERRLLDEDGVRTEFVFPSERSATRPMSENTVRIAIRSMGLGPDKMTAHGFRHMASTILNESGLWSADAIEMQLAHSAGGVREIYNQAKYMPERVRMMQWYADELDGLSGGGIS